MRRRTIKFLLISMTLALAIVAGACSPDDTSQATGNSQTESAAQQPTSQATTSTTIQTTADQADIQDILDSLGELDALEDSLDDINSSDIVIPET